MCWIVSVSLCLCGYSFTTETQRHREELSFLSSHRSRFQNQFSSDQVEQNSEKQEWNDAQHIRSRTFEEGVVMSRPFLKTFELTHDAFLQIEESVDDTR